MANVSFSAAGDTLYAYLAGEIDHDAAQPVAYRVCCGRKQGAVATDMGHFDYYIIEHLQELDAILLEYNHDVRMLATGPSH